MGTILLIILILLLVGALPSWPYSCGLGLLSERRIGSCARHYHCSFTHGEDLTRRFMGGAWLMEVGL